MDSNRNLSLSRMFKSTGTWSNYWKRRKIDWKSSYQDTWDHPHRNLIVEALKRLNIGSVLEIGCASGPNLIRIKKELPNVQVGGVDVSADAINLAKRTFPDGIFDVRSATELFYDKKCADSGLSDMTLIYVSPRDIKKALSELKRCVRKGVVLCEFYHPNPFLRFALRWSGYHAHNYPKLLNDLGFYDIQIRKLSKNDWPGGQPQETYGYLITART